jgi:hypothetical protein
MSEKKELTAKSKKQELVSEWKPFTAKVEVADLAWDFVEQDFMSLDVVGDKLMSTSKIKLTIETPDGQEVRINYRLNINDWNRHKMNEDDNIHLLEGLNVKVRGLKRINKGEKYPFVLENGVDTHEYDEPYYHLDNARIPRGEQ